MNSFTRSRVDEINRRVTRLATDEFESPDAIIAALNEVSTHLTYAMPGPLPPRLIASWPVENQDDKGYSYGVMGGADISDSFAAASCYQTIELAAGGKLSSFKLWVRAQTGNFDVLVQVMDAGGAVGTVIPTGPVLATSEVIPNASIDRVDGSMQEFLFTGANQIDLVAGQVYAFVFTYAGSFPPTGEWIYCGQNWVSTPPNNCGFYQGNKWNPDDGGVFTFYLYAT